MKSVRLTLLIAIFSLSASFVAEAATLSVNPVSAKVSVGDRISVTVTVNAAGQAINNAEGIVHFPPELLRAISVSKSGSVFSLWVGEPAIGNGEVSFNGGVPNPGFSGANGQVISMVFEARKAGTASLFISDAAVRANDGMGTDVLKSSSGAQFTLANVPVVAPVAPVVPVEEPTPTPVVITEPVIQFNDPGLFQEPAPEILPAADPGRPTHFLLLLAPALGALLLCLLIWAAYALYRKTGLSPKAARVPAEIIPPHTSANRIEQAFVLLYEDVQAQLHHFEKVSADRKLNADEKKFVRKFTKDLDELDRMLGDDIQKVKHEIRKKLLAIVDGDK